MSSNEDDCNDVDSTGIYQSLKKRRIQRACDVCRRKKIRCDGVQMPGSNCSNCEAYNYQCTYVEAAKKRGPPKGYVESLENRIEKLDKLLKRLCPEESIYQQLTASLNANWTEEQPPMEQSTLVGESSDNRPSPPITALESLSTAIRGVNLPSRRDMTEDDDDNALILADSLKKMEIDKSDFRFFGKSSGAMLVRTALELKSEYIGAEMADNSISNTLKNRRKEFWTARPWEKKDYAKPTPHFILPELDLAWHCIDLYFNCANLYLPLLHRPTFEQAVEENLHLTDDNFTPVYLLVCAVGARFSSDPRTLLDGVDSYHSCGWKWFEQVQLVKKTLLHPPTLYELQLYCLYVQFLLGSSAPQSCWTMVGIGIRLAQDVGAHRRKVHNHTLTAEDELWKRAFWVLVCMDRLVSSSLGRPCAIQDEDFDLDFPVDCDDEYWDNEDPEKRFKQPPNKPSKMVSFILYLKLQQILAFSLRTIYSINKSKVLLGFVGQQWEQHIVAELDSALNKWVDSVPDHLRWDPNREDNDFFNQSVVLYSAYYHIQILIHRPFIPSPSKPSPLSFPSLAICTNAARSCSHVVDIQRKRNPFPPPQIQMAIFTAGIVLLLSIWGGKRSGLSIDPNKEMADVHKCMQALRANETRWHSAGRLWDILYELASVGELPLPHPSPPATNKRERGSEIPISSNSGERSLPSMVPIDAPRNIAGSRRVKQEMNAGSLSRKHSQVQIRDQQSEHQQMVVPPALYREQPQVQRQLQPPTPVECFALPVYSAELSRLPLHGQVTFSAQAQNPAQPPPADSWFQRAGGNVNLQSTLNNMSSFYLRQPPSPTQVPPNVSQLSKVADSSFSQIYNMDAAAMAAGMMFDTMPGTLAYDRQSSYGMGQMETTSTIQPTVESSNRASFEQSKRGQQHQQQQESMGQLPGNSHEMDYQGTIAMWSKAPSGFELDEWGTYLTKELTQVHGLNPQ